MLPTDTAVLQMLVLDATLRRRSAIKMRAKQRGPCFDDAEIYTPAPPSRSMAVSPHILVAMFSSTARWVVDLCLAAAWS